MTAKSSELATLSDGTLAPGGDDSWFREVIHGFIGTAATLQEFRETFAADLGITPNQYLVLISVATLQSDEGPGISDLARYLGMAQPHVTTDAGRLVRLGLLTKTPHPGNRRSLRLALSPEGRVALARVSGLVRLVNDTLFADISREELALLHSLCRKVTRNAIRARAEVALSRNQP